VTFLLFWNAVTGVKQPGQEVGRLVWEEDRERWLERLWKEK
jgi:hypothetical protein